MIWPFVHCRADRAPIMRACVLSSLLFLFLRLRLTLSFLSRRAASVSMAAPLRIVRRLSALAERSQDLRSFIDGTPPSAASFTFHPHFFNEEEQATLLRCFLRKLDSTSSPQRRRRKIHKPASSPYSNYGGIMSLFDPDPSYELEAVREIAIGLMDKTHQPPGPLRWSDKELPRNARIKLA